MRLVIVSGVSGSGKTVALHTLEDGGFYCVDNLPLGLLPAFVRQFRDQAPAFDAAAVGVDIRCGLTDFERLDTILAESPVDAADLDIVFLTAETDTLLTRFSETRRKHPLSDRDLPLADAIREEQRILRPLQERADLVIDTTSTSVHELRAQLGERLVRPHRPGISLLIQSFGFKHGVPPDSDFVFDVRCLPNPHWDRDLRPHTGLDAPVVDFLEGYPAVGEMYADILGFVQRWLPRFERENRSYLTVSVGCTGGRHRSVYLTHRLYRELGEQVDQLSLSHRELGGLACPPE